MESSSTQCSPSFSSFGAHVPTQKKKKCNAIENYDVIAGVSFRNIKFNAFSEWRKKLGAKRKRKRRDSYRRLAEATEWKRKHEKNVDRHFQLIQSK